MLDGATLNGLSHLFVQALLRDYPAWEQFLRIIEDGGTGERAVVLEVA